MRCYFMRGGHIEAVEELGKLSDGEPIAKAHTLFSERKLLFFSNASSCGIARPCLSGIPIPLPQTTSPSGPFIGDLGRAAASVRLADSQK